MNILILYIFSIFSAFAMPQQTITVGGSIEIQAEPHDDVLIKGENVVVESESATSIKLKGLKPGSTIVKIGDTQYSIHVLPAPRYSLQSELSTLLAKKRGLTAQISGVSMTVRGECYRINDWLDFVRFSEKHDLQLIFKARFYKELKEDIRNYIGASFKERNLPVPTVILSEHPTLEFHTSYKKMEQYLQVETRKLGFQIDFQEGTLTSEQLIRVKIVIAELNRSLNRKLGVNWPDQLTATLLPGFNASNKLEGILNLVEDRGQGQILASPNLLARSGSEAEFLAGGEIPIRITTERRLDVQWKKHGIYLKFKPISDSEGKMRIEIIVEVSMIDNGASIDGIPALKTTRLSTHFDLPQPRTIALSGLLKQDLGTSENNFPWLSQIPVLGNIFKSKDFRAAKSELVIFVTPEFVQHETESPNTPQGWRPFGNLND